MKIVKKPATRSGSMSDANSYAENAKAYCSRSGRADGSHPVIVKGSPEWALWMEYFSHIGHAHANPRSFANNVGRLTVPSRSPDEFEPGWRASEGATASEGNGLASRVAATRSTACAKPADGKRRVTDMYQATMQSLRSAGLKIREAAE